MKRLPFVSILLSLIFTTGFLYADNQKISYSDSWGDPGITLKSSGSSGVEINYSVTEFSFSSKMINREEMQHITLRGTFLPNEEGAPDLPGESRYIAVPEGAIAVLNIKNYRTETFSGIDMAPAPRIPLETEDGPLQYTRNEEIYSRDAFYPEKPFRLSEISQIRGVDVVILGITPFQYNPVSKELIVYRDIEIEVTFEGGTGYFGEDRLRSRWWDPIVKDMVLNSESIPGIDYNRRYLNQSRDSDGCEYLIVSPDGEEFQRWADSIKAFRTLQGILTEVVTLSEIGGNTPELLEDYFNNAYENWSIPPAAVLLLGDYGTENNMESSVTSPVWQSYCVSDNIFADVDNDDMPDMAFARITANNEEQLQTMVTKSIDYERNPPTNPGFYDHPITALGWQTERWFQICSETVGGYFKHVHGKDPVRINAIYDGNPNSDPWSTATNTSTVLNYFGPDGLGYIPETPGELGGWTGGNATDVNNAINSGAFILQHRDHGGETGWGEPDYDNGDINDLVNTDLTFVFSINCLTGKYNWSGECFTEKFHRYTHDGLNSGALGLIAASEVSYSFVNDTYVWGMFDNMWPDFMPDINAPPVPRGQLPAFGNAGGKYFLQSSQWPYNTDNKEVTYNLFHHHGDAFLTLFSEVPQELTVSHNPILYSGESTYTVTADEDSYIALTVNGEIIGTGEGTGAPAQIGIIPQLPPNQMHVTITKQNHFRYTSVVDVIPPEGPYVVFDNYSINDENGNNNGVVDYGETILLDVTTHNVGVEAAEDVVVTIISDDDYISIVDNEENFGTIDAEGFVTMEDAFSFEVSDSIPDNHKINFTLNASDVNDSSWLSYFTITAKAPVLTIGNYSIVDPTGNNNGRLDPGETVDVYVFASNEGQSTAAETMSTLTSASPYITVNSGSYEAGNIQPEETVQLMFNITADAGAPIGSLCDMHVIVASGQYTASKTFVPKIGLILEDFETGDFTSFEWQHGGDANWTISQQEPFEGTYCAKSGAIGNLSTTQLIISYEVMSDDSISFYRKVSTETGYDYLKFYIDNVKVDQWAGEHGWERVAYAIDAGPHVFKWIYEKDWYVTGGQDCVWLDYISLPPPLTTTAYAGPDMNICQQEVCMLEGNATHYESLMWTTSGDGMFDDPTILNPEYIPGNEDINSQTVTLTLTAYGPSRSDAYDDMILTINQMPEASTGDDLAICAGDYYEAQDATAENYTSLQWTTSGDGMFNDPTMLNPEYMPGEGDIESGAVTLTLTAANPGCGEVSDEVMLTIHALPEPLISGSETACQHMEGYSYSTPEVAGCSYAWEISGGSLIEGQNTHTVSVIWEEEGERMLTLTETIEETGCFAVDEYTVMVNPAPQPEVSGAETACEMEAGLLYTTPYVEGNTYEWIISGGTMSEGKEPNEAIVAWETPGEGNIRVIETITETGCEASGEMAVMVYALPVITIADTAICHNHVITLDAGNPNAQSWTWSTGETTQTIQVDSSGAGFSGTKEISVEVISEEGCSAEKQIVVSIEDCSGIHENGLGAEVRVFPNPSNGSFTIELSSYKSEIVDIRIADALGSVVYQKNNIVISRTVSANITIDKNAEGMYYLFIEGDNGSTVKKIIVKK